MIKSIEEKRAHNNLIKRIWRDKNREKLKKINKTFREKHKEKIREQRKKYKNYQKDYSKQWRLENRDKIKSYRVDNKERNKIKVKEYHHKNPDKLKKARKKWSEANKEYLKQLQKKYIKKYNYDNPKYKKEWRIKNREKAKKYRNKYLQSEKGQINHLWDKLRNRIKIYTFNKRQTTRKDMDSLIGCSRIFLLRFIESKFYTHPLNNYKMTWKNNKKWHIDHITPLAKLNPLNDVDFRMANHFINLQPMWAEENLKKSSNIVPGFGVANLKRKYKKILTLGDLTKIRNKVEIKKTIEIIKEFNF